MGVLLIWQASVTCTVCFEETLGRDCIRLVRLH